MTTEVDFIPARRKAAIVLLRLGPEQAAPLLRNLSRPELNAVIAEVANLGLVDHEVADAVVAEFLEATGAEALPPGDQDLAFDMLESTFGQRQAREVMSELRGESLHIPFQFLDDLEPSIIAENLLGEQPQTIALVLSHLTADMAARIVAFLPGELVVQIGLRLGQMDRVSGDALVAVEDGLRHRFSAELEETFLDATGGVDALVEMLTLADKTVEEVVLAGLADVDPAMANEIRAKMFVFSDLTLLDDRQMQLVLRSVDMARLPLALKGVSEAVSDKILNNLSSRARENLLDEIELLGSVRMADVEEAQQEVLESVRNLEESGELVINRGGADFVD